MPIFLERKSSKETDSCLTSLSVVRVARKGREERDVHTYVQEKSRQEKRERELREKGDKKGEERRGRFDKA